MRRVGVAVLGAVAGALLLSGCTAVDLPLAAVRIGADGQPWALIRPCGDDSYLEPDLEGRAGRTESGAVASGWSTDGEAEGDAEFPLFTPPPAWTAQPVGAQRLLSDHTYVLAFGHYVTGDSYNGIVTFTAADLATLEAGQVWADGRPMSLGEFEELAEGSC
ncbi:hypothetical protein SAMN06272735_6065 [Streptomyces sp. TLI_55]|uniref:hypothetical protein n=1 Tax=Streptomyces sp. TLI_55 TaxID=1938861 RepID=UPI000BCEF169|nr:hypothetical protein [Streptomyces sp. TLI_55]SNX64249.1 hypothetical protein SAMN06272735_6065 [Streptomyces sp. TLI_55]